MMFRNLRVSDISIFCGLIALVIFGHISMWRGTAHAGGLDPLLLQGGGSSYSIQVDERVSSLEMNARQTLLEIGSAQAAYRSNRTAGRYAWLQELVISGYLQPNVSGRTLVSDYSITFYMPSGRQGFTLIAEPMDPELRPFMLTENQQVVLITPSIMGDPNQDWADVREMESVLLYDRGRYDYPISLQLLSCYPPLQVRLNRENTSYLIFELVEDSERGLVPEDSLVYVSWFAAYMIGDTREYDVYW